MKLRLMICRAAADTPPTEPRLVSPSFAASRRASIVGLALISVAACTGDKARVVARTYGPRHPLQENLYRPVPVTSTVRIDASATDESPFVRALRRARPVLKVGVLEGEEQYIFGRIVDAMVDAKGRLFVLDAASSQVRVFGRNGKWLATFGRNGRGPGEFTRPSALRIIRQVVYVVDVYGVHVFTEVGQEYAFDRMIKAAFQVVDLCDIDGRLYVHGVRPANDSLIFELDTTGVRRSFGRVYNSNGPIVALHLNQSRLACSPKTQTLVLGPTGVIGELHAYRDSGKPAWLVSVEGFRAAEFRESSTGGSRTRIPPEGYDRLSSLTYAPAGYFVAQALYLSEHDYGEKVRPYTSLFTFVVDERTGHAVVVGNDLPPITAFGANSMISVVQDPYPQVTVYAW